ncbi:hypothetical protein [Sphingomonas sp.]|uniref:hypothetical protein n=1 Tax=Sphingomonas sp. TaxID=28214 RepID=UPI00286C589B|nr:hypothetical protein [Sphingomonas sp.]
MTFEQPSEGWLTGFTSEYMSEAPELVDHLIGYGLITAHDGAYSIAFSAVGRVVASLRQDIVALCSKDERWSTACVRRNTVEQAIRSALYFWSKTLSSDFWQEILKKSLTDSRFAVLASTEPNYLFSSKESPLFMSDLGGFLRSEGVLDYLGNRKERLASAAMKVNALRKEAHGNDFDDTEFAALCAALSELEDEFLLP